jgi:hypothetical protein
MSPEARERSFDELARGLASGSVSRRRALRLMGAAVVGGALASLGIREAAADPPGCKRNGKNCTKDKVCCSGNCESGTCAAAPPTCVANGGTCSTSTDCCSGNCSNGFCCASGRVGLSNGTCAIPCTTAPECTGGCECTGRSVNPAQGFCGTLMLGGGCATDAECPTGQFCSNQGFGGDVCMQAC